MNNPTPTPSSPALSEEAIIEALAERVATGTRVHAQAIGTDMALLRGALRALAPVFQQIEAAA